jgi:histidinol phosphatase-like enzyme
VKWRPLWPESWPTAAVIDGVLACPYHREGLGSWAHPDHPGRKPQPGMLLAAARLLGLDLSRSWIIGDRHGDLVAGDKAGLAYRPRCRASSPGARLEAGAI